MQILGSVNLSSDLQVFSLILYLILRAVADVYCTSTCSLPLFTLPILNLFRHGVMSDILIRWLVDGSLRIDHVRHSLFQVDQLAQVALCQ